MSESKTETSQKRSNLNEKGDPEGTVQNSTVNEEVKFGVQRTSFSDVSNEDILGPSKIDITSVGLSALGSIAAGFLGGLFVLLFTYVFLGSLQTSGIFPYILSLVGFFAILITVSVSFVLNRLLFPVKYKEGSVVLGQMTILSIFFFILVSPLYIYINWVKQDALIFIFFFHITINILATSLLGEILSSYRYVLLSIYGSFIGFFATSILSVVFFMNFSLSINAIYSLIGVIIVVNFIITLFRLLFELVYYKIYTKTGTDHLGDIFAQIENEEKEILAKAEKELGTFE
ncbi:hypothetical protein AUK10_02155 [Candidatus Gracilibacteria bacterium CG2_30_37_12]|nr:MAG: hypothetical protein AUK10_02155 [Candidatus Gracilibacteria bacterium CG2_30_37_12]